MRNKWKDRENAEKSASIVNCALFGGMILCMLLYYLRDWQDGSNLSWLLFTLHYFSDAVFLWKTNHDTAVRSLCMGCFLALMLSPILLMYLL